MYTYRLAIQGGRDFDSWNFGTIIIYALAELAPSSPGACVDIEYLWCDPCIMHVQGIRVRLRGDIQWLHIIIGLAISLSPPDFDCTN